MRRIDDEDDDDRPVRKKKKKKKEQPTSLVWLKLVGIGAGGLAAIGLIVLIISAISSAATIPPAQAVTAWDRFSTEEAGFAFEYPKGWRSSSYGIKNQREAEIKSRHGLITVKENLVGSLVGDIAGAGLGGREVSDELLPVSQVHTLRRPKDMPASYKEEPAMTVMTKFGKVRRSAYTDGSKRGYRVTVLMHQSALDIYCECRDTDWDVLRPAFDHVIESMGPGGG